MKLFSKVTSISTAAYIFVSAAQTAFADDLGEVTPGPLKPLTPSQLITFIINAFFFIAIVAALVYLLWGGLNWILSGGDKDKIEAARSRIVAAIIGLVLVVLAYFILDFVLKVLGLCGIQNLVIPTLSGTNLQGC